MVEDNGNVSGCSEEHGHRTDSGICSGMAAEGFRIVQ